MPITNKTSLMIYGASNSGKSTQARYLAEHVHTTTGKKTRLIALDRVQAEDEIFREITLQQEHKIDLYF